MTKHHTGHTASVNLIRHMRKRKPYMLERHRNAISPTIFVMMDDMNYVLEFFSAYDFPRIRTLNEFNSWLISTNNRIVEMDNDPVVSIVVGFYPKSWAWEEARMDWEQKHPGEPFRG